LGTEGTSASHPADTGPAPAAETRRRRNPLMLAAGLALLAAAAAFAAVMADQVSEPARNPDPFTARSTDGGYR